MTRLLRILVPICLLLGFLTGAIPGVAQTWAPYHPPLPPQAVVGSTAQRQAAYNSLTADQRRTINDIVRPYLQRAIVQAIINNQNNITNQDLKVHAPNVDGLMQHDLSRTPSLQNSFAFINNSSTVSMVPQYPTAATAFPANAAASPVTGFDLDHDGLPDNFENQLADSFTPFYHVSAGEVDNFATFFDSVPETVNQRLGQSPFSYFRVKPLGFATNTNGVEYGFLQVNYLTLWDHDSGLQISGTCNTFIGLAGGVVGISLLDLMGVLTSHNLDDEHSAALLAAPAVNGSFNLDPSQYFGIDYFFAAHEGTFFDHSAYGNPGTPVPANIHLELGLSLAKHSTYSFNPDGLPMFPDWLISTYYATLLDLLNQGIISQTSFDYLTFVGDTVFFSCVIEHFSDQGGSFASQRVNVGEPVSGSTLNGSGFILDPNHAFPKLTETLWIVNQPPIIVVVSPAAAGVDSGQTQQFQATVLNDNNQGVTWSINPQVGSITQAGLYTAPTVTGQQTVTVTACSTDTPSRCGTALIFLNPLAQACLSPTSLNFGNQGTGTTSAAQTITLTSCGAADLLINSVTVSGNFAQTNNCPVSLAVNASCTINVTFTPPATGTLTGTLSVSDSAHNSPQSTSLTGTGVPPPDFTLSIDPDQTIDTSVTQYATVHYNVTYLNGLTGTVSLSLVEPCMGMVVPLNPSAFSTSGTGTISLGPFAAGETGTMCFYLTATHGSLSKLAITTVTLTYPSGGN